MFHRNEKKLQTYLHKHFWSASMLIVCLKRFIHYHVKRHQTKNRERLKSWWKFHIKRLTKLYINDIKIDIFTCHFRLDPISRPVFTFIYFLLKGNVEYNTHSDRMCISSFWWLTFLLDNRQKFVVIIQLYLLLHYRLSTDIALLRHTNHV